MLNENGAENLTGSRNCATTPITKSEMVFGEADARAAYQRAAAFLDRIRALLTDYIPLDELEPV